MRLLLLVGLAVLAPVLRAQPDGEAQYPIDARWDACVERDGSTAGMLACAAEAYVEWDAELNQRYDRLSADLGAADRRALRDAQRRWVAFRDAEFAALRAALPDDGSMWPVVYGNLRVDRVRQRALDLADYWYLLHPEDEGGDF